MSGLPKKLSCVKQYSVSSYFDLKPLPELEGQHTTLVYKVNKALQALPPGNGHPSLDHVDEETLTASRTDTDGADIDADPEIIALKKELRMAELKRQIAETMAPIAMDSRLTQLEKRLATMTNSSNTC